MATTKERILDAALQLFARDGFEAASTSAIANELGMTKGALYKHFPSKQAIFDSLVESMLDGNESAIVQSGFASGSVDESAEKYAAATAEDMADLGEKLFRLWTEDGSHVAFRRMLSIERFRNERAASTFDRLFVSGPLGYHQALFARMIELGSLDPHDPQQMALEFWSPIFLLMQATDGSLDLDEAVRKLRTHVAAFSKTHERKAHD